MASIINAITTGAGGLSTTADASGNINIQSGGTTVLGVTSAGVAVTGTMTVGGNSVITSASSVSASNITGTLPIANGGTNNASLAVTAGGVVYTDGSKLVNVGAGSSGQVLQSNGASAPSWVAASAGGLGGQTVYTSNGTFTIPSGKTVVKVTVVGAGGGSQSQNDSFSAMGGGGGGGTAIKYLTGLTPGNTLTVTIGTGSSAGSGGTSSAASGTQTISTVSATGGAVGPRVSYGFSGPTLNSGNASGGSGSGGDTNITGGQGGNSTMYQASVGCATFYYGIAGSGGSSVLGFGAQGTGGYVNGTAESFNTSSGTLYGGGSSGATNSSGSTTARAGGNGIIIFEY